MRARWTMLGIVCKYTGRFDEGRLLYERALLLVPPDSVEAAAILHNLGGIEHARGRNAEAEVPARRAVEVRSPSARSRRARGG